MTREEAKTIQNYMDARFIDEADSLFIDSGEVSELLDKIYDDFESRTCENCKYGSIEDEGLILCNESFYDNCIYDTNENLINDAMFYPDKDFGCNKFEQKDGK